ncbi:hypothetical protein H6F90_21765 [Trichocoleus sp. FACHB-591]|nr:hypothetical protein [Trichocoleus sp. FACHB-591]
MITLQEYLAASVDQVEQAVAYLVVSSNVRTLEKRGKFKAFEQLVPVLHGNRGVHLVVLYIVVGP